MGACDLNELFLVDFDVFVVMATIIFNCIVKIFLAFLLIYFFE